ncbi:MAG: hypothetical protein WEE69_08605 [Acidimicrobiia bacterium]
MPYVVMCGPAHTSPDKIVGPFESGDDAAQFTAGEPGAPERYAEVRELVPPPG